MNDLSKKERLEQRILELEHLIAKKDYDFDKEQGKRIRTTFFVICGVIYFLLLVFALKGDISVADGNALNNTDAMEIIENIFYAVVALTFGVGFVAGVIMFISFGVWFYVDNGAMKRVETIAKLEGELNALKSEKHNNFEDKKTEEIKADLKLLNTLLRHIVDEYKNLELIEDFENDAEENEILKLQLEDLKFSLKMIDKESYDEIVSKLQKKKFI